MIVLRSWQFYHQYGIIFLIESSTLSMSSHSLSLRICFSPTHSLIRSFYFSISQSFFVMQKHAHSFTHSLTHPLIWSPSRPFPFHATYTICGNGNKIICEKVIYIEIKSHSMTIFHSFHCISNEFMHTYIQTYK